MYLFLRHGIIKYMIYMHIWILHDHFCGFCVSYNKQQIYVNYTPQKTILSIP